jgi:integrase
MPSVTLWQARSEYLEHLKAQGMAVSTISGHGIILNHCLDTWGDIDVRDISQGDVDKLFAKGQWATGTQNLYLWNLRSFVRYLRRQNYIPKDADPTDGWKTRRTPQRSRTWLTLPELTEMFNAAWCPRDRALMVVGAYTFLRGSEIAALTIGDLDLEADELDVYRIKGRVADRLPICTELKNELAIWLAYYENECGPLQQTWLLIPARGPIPMRGVIGERRLEPTGEPAPLKPCSPVTKPYSVVRRAMKDVGFDHVGDGCHVLRRSGARNLFERLRADGHDGALRRVSSMLGHSSTLITEHYLGVDAERRQRNTLLSGKEMFPAANPAA